MQNTANSAIWWVLESQAVRDLGMLLTGPPLWNTQREISKRDLLGDRGFDFLLELNRNPAALHSYLHAQKRTNRLGVYAEHLLAFWFSHAPGMKLLARNIQVTDTPKNHGAGSPTLGELDFLLDLNGNVVALEVACKFYGGKHEGYLRGLNPNDTLMLKREKLLSQLELSQSFAVKQYLTKRGLPVPETSLSLLRGQYFLPENESVTMFEPDAWRGLFSFDVAHDVARWLGNDFAQHYRFSAIDRLALLSPLKLPADLTFTLSEVLATGARLISVLKPVVTGSQWREVMRLMRSENGLKAQRDPNRAKV